MVKRYDPKSKTSEHRLIGIGRNIGFSFPKQMAIKLKITNGTMFHVAITEEGITIRKNPNLKKVRRGCDHTAIELGSPHSAREIGFGAYHVFGIGFSKRLVERFGLKKGDVLNAELLADGLLIPSYMKATWKEKPLTLDAISK